MESLKEKMGRGPKKIKEQQDLTNKELAPVLKEIEEYNKRKEELQNEFNKLGHREGEQRVFNKDVVKTDIEGDSYINFLGTNYYLSGNRGRLYEAKKDDEGEGYLYIGGTDSYNYNHWSGECYILRSNGMIFDGRKWMIGGTGTRFSPNGMIYNGNTSRGEPINPNEESGFLFHLRGSYYEPEGKKTTYDIFQGISKDLDYIYEETEGNQTNKKQKNIFGINLNFNKNKKQDKQDKPASNGFDKPNQSHAHKMMMGRGKIIGTTIEELGKTIEHTLSSRDEKVEFTEEDENFVFRTPEGNQLSFPLEKGEIFIKAVADLINRSLYLSKTNGFGGFDSDESNLRVSNKIKPGSNIILRNIQEKLGISAKDLTKRLNDYVYENKYKKYRTSKEKRGRPKKY